MIKDKTLDEIIKCYIERYDVAIESFTKPALDALLNKIEEQPWDKSVKEDGKPNCKEAKK